MIKKLTLIFPFLFLCAFLFYYCGKSPTAPEPPKKKAIITVEVASWPLNVHWISWPDLVSISFNIIVSESNGVAGRVSKAQAKVYIGDKFKAQDTSDGGRFAAFGSWEGYFWLDVYGPDYEVDKLVITVEGGDDNGFPFEKTVSYTLSW